jgi:hypothetical protein
MPQRIVKYIIAGDTKSGVRAMHDMGDATDKTGKKLDHAGHEAERSFANIEKGAKHVHGAIGLLAGAAGLGGLAFGIKDAVEAGTQLQVQQAQLRNALKNTGQASAETVKKITEAAEASSTHGGFKGQQELEGITQFVRLTGSATAATKLNTEAVNLARGTHMSYETAIRAVSQVQTGQVGRLQKYLGVIQPVKTHVQELTALQKKQNPELVKQAQLLDKQATAAEANRQIMKRYAGATSTYGRTAAGSISNAQHAIELLAEQVGKVLLPYVAYAATELTRLIDIGIEKWPEAKAKIEEVVKSVKEIVAWFRKHMDVTKALAAGVAVLVTAWTAYTVATKIATVATAAFNAVMALNPIEWVVIAIAALTAGVVYCYLHFKTFRNIVDSVFKWLKGAVGTVVGFVKKHWKTLALVLAGPFTPLVLLLEHIKTVIHDIVGAASKVGKAYHSVTGAPGKFLGHLVPHFATGGIVPGVGSRDTVPAMLTPGEGVLRQRAVQAVGGASGVAALNNGGALMPDINLTLPVKLVATDGGRTLAETVVHYQLRQQARR